MSVRSACSAGTVQATTVNWGGIAKFCGRSGATRIVPPASAGCCTNLELAVSEGAGIKADLAPADATVAAKGLIAKSILPAAAGETILVAPDIPQDFAMPPKFSVVACAVPAEQADLTDTLRAAYVSKYTGRIEKDAETYASEGLVTYTATWTKTGFTVIFR